MFPCCPLYGYFLRLHLDKLLEYALTEVTHRFCGKRRALSNFLKAISFYYLNRKCHICTCSQRDRSKPGELSQNKDISMILREADICPLPETPSLPLQ